MKSTLIIFGLVLLLIVASCAKPDNLSNLPSSTENSVPHFTVTSTVSMNHTPTLTPTPSLTPTIIPTLPMEDAHLRLLDLLVNNGNCRLPCMWGITPGQSSILDSKAILIPLSGISYYTNFGPDFGRVSPEYIEGNLMVFVRISFAAYSNKDIINRVSFDVRALKRIENDYQDIFDSDVFSERANYYMLSNILAEYGPPESVRLATQARESTRDNAGGGFHILLLYPDQGILALYTTQMHVVGSNVRGCPANAHVQLDLYPPGQRDEFLATFNTTSESQAYPKRFLEEVTSMSLDEFYQTFRQSTDACVETPASLWPIPE